MSATVDRARELFPRADDAWYPAMLVLANDAPYAGHRIPTSKARLLETGGFDSIKVPALKLIFTCDDNAVMIHAARFRLGSVFVHSKMFAEAA